MLERRPTSIARVGLLVAIALSIGLPVLFVASQLIVAADGRTLDAGETVMYLQPTEYGRTWQGPYTIEGRTRDGRLILTGPAGTVRAEADEVAPVNRW